jgi:hypothetical protein
MEKIDDVTYLKKLKIFNSFYVLAFEQLIFFENNYFF